MGEGIPQFTLARQQPALLPEFEAAARRVLASARLVQGAEVEAFEAELAAHLGGSRQVNVVACANGTDALHLALRAAGVGVGDVVITTPFTFFATVGAVLLTGARVAFADIDPVSFNLDPGALAKALRRRRGRVAAILPVHLYGRMAAMPAILAVAAEAGVPVIEDAAQACGVRIAAGAAGTLGLAGAISFYPTKNLGALGEAGCVVTRSAAFARRLRMLRSHGSPRRYQHDLLGWNARLDELQAALLRVKLPHLAAWTARRRELAAAYEAALLATGRARLAGPDAAMAAAAGSVVLPERTPEHGFHQYTIRTARRDQLREFLRERGIGSEVYYPLAAHRQRALAAAQPDAKPPALPHSDQAAREVLSLPMFPELTEAEIGRVAEAVGEFQGRRGGRSERTRRR